jgi:hypothetical protein
MCVLSCNTTLKFYSNLAILSSEKVRICCQIFSKKNYIAPKNTGPNKSTIIPACYCWHGRRGFWAGKGGTCPVAPCKASTASSDPLTSQIPQVLPPKCHPMWVLSCLLSLFNTCRCGAHHRCRSILLYCRFIFTFATYPYLDFVLPQIIGLLLLQWSNILCICWEIFHSLDECLNVITFYLQMNILYTCMQNLHFKLIMTKKCP